MTIIDKDNLISARTIKLLQRVMRRKFNFGSYRSWNDLLSKLSVDVVIDSRIIECVKPVYPNHSIYLQEYKADLKLEPTPIPVVLKEIVHPHANPSTSFSSYQMVAYCV